VRHVLGWEPEDLLGKTMCEFVSPADIARIEVFETPAPAPGQTPPATLNSMLIADADADDLTDDSISIAGADFEASINFRQGYTYDMVIEAADPETGTTTTFRLPGPAGSSTRKMAFRLEYPSNPGLLFKVRQWACRSLGEANCIDGFRVRTTSGPGAWVPVDDTNYYQTYVCNDPNCYVQPNGEYGWWDRDHTWEIPTVGGKPSQDVRVQYVYRPVERSNDQGPLPPDP
jgi:hypothetical protein